MQTVEVFKAQLGKTRLRRILRVVSVRVTEISCGKS